MGEQGLDADGVISDAPSRRSFLGRLLGGTLLAGAAGVLGSIVAYLLPTAEVRSSLGPQRLRVGRADEFAVGEAKLALVDDEPVWVLKLATGFVALSATCTHKGCTIKWEGERRLFGCPCHEGRFDERGNVLSGLPRRPLQHFRVGIVGGDVFVSRGGDHSA
jgi:cytochrome b6-f complex iron-sulfur subunit